MSGRVEPVLAFDGVVAGYVPDADILNGVNIEVHGREIVTVVGPNGAGKSTLMKVACGLVAPRRGSVCLRGADIAARQPHEIARCGVGYVPQLDNVFRAMSVEENLELGAIAFPAVDRRTRMAALYELFPVLRERRRQAAGTLSGGERQMVAIARALMPDPSLLLLDEPSAGLAPAYISVMFELIAEINRRGVSVLMVEQNARRALAMSDRGYVLELGKNAFQGPGPQLLADPEVAELYLGGASSADGRSAPVMGASSLGTRE